MWPLAAQALGDVEPVQALHPVKVSGHLGGFAALYGADAVPLQRMQSLFAQGGDFGNTFLYIVFSKGSLPRQGSAGNRIGRKSLGYREQADTVRRTTGLRHGLGNALLYLCQCLCDIA